MLQILLFTWKLKKKLSTPWKDYGKWYVGRKYVSFVTSRDLSIDFSFLQIKSCNFDHEGVIGIMEKGKRYKALILVKILLCISLQFYYFLFWVNIIIYDKTLISFQRLFKLWNLLKINFKNLPKAFKDKKFQEFQNCVKAKGLKFCHHHNISHYFIFLCSSVNLNNFQNDNFVFVTS